MADIESVPEKDELPTEASVDEAGSHPRESLTDSKQEKNQPPENEDETEPTVDKDEKADKPTNEPKSKPHHRLIAWYKANLKLAIPATILVILVLFVAIPFLRYNTVGLILKKNFTLQVIDSETTSPVSGATVSMNSGTAQTDGSGKAVIKVRVGPRSATISKKYYTTTQAKVTVPILSQKSVPAVKLTATGRQVKINVVNTISKKSLTSVSIKVADITAQTDASGNAMVVLPPGVAEQKATLTATGYNDTVATVKVSDTSVAENNFTLTPAGRVYFLSKRTGKIDVMKANLDGGDQKVVLAGTGTEDDSDTILLASRDWKYLALKSKRDNSPAKLYYIDTSVDKLNTLDEGNADFTLIGWSGDVFVYQVNRNGVADWQPNRQALKSFNAPSGKLTLLNQTGAAGSGSDLFAYEYYGNNTYIIDNTLIFTKTWSHNYAFPHAAAGKQSGIYSISVDATNAKTLKSFDFPPNTAASHVYFGSAPYEPRGIYYEVNYGDLSDSLTYYKYENDSLSNDNALADAYNKLQSQPYPTYLLSPSSKQTFWTEPRDGKSAMLVGDQDGKNSKVVSTLSTDYLNYGWYGDSYLFVSKKSSELYVMPAAGAKAETDLIKISDYHKPAYFFYGYGGGYGGL